MAEDFSQRTSPIAVLRSILAGYPFSAGILKEIIQNSEDAKATKQVFILDRRTHPSGNLYCADLAPSQGPALLSFNDATFKDEDWGALRNMYQSSKVSDKSKIGKFGIGFRSVFHLTDCPQILSGRNFAIFDPLQAFTGSEGKKFSADDVVKNYPDHIQSILPSSFKDLFQDGEFDGTIIRCPLRANLVASSGHDVHGGLSNEIVTPDRISKILDDFVAQGLDDTALFLRNLQEVTIIEINKSGIPTEVAKVTLTRSDPVRRNDVSSVRQVETKISRQWSSATRSETWIMTDCPFPDTEARRLLSQCVVPDTNVAATIHTHKLNATVTLAVRVQRPTEVTGKLFTHLPLPITTSFNTHINAMFALTSDRQHLLNAEDGGVASGSSDHILRTWNNLLFDHFIPRAWKEYLEYVASTATSPESIYAAWPKPTTGSYSKNVPLKLLEFVVGGSMVIWPVVPPSGRSCGTNLKALDSRDVVVAGPGDSVATVEALTTLGVDVIHLPQGIWALLQTSPMKNRVALLTPASARDALLRKPNKFSSTSANTRSTILQYVLSDGDLRNLVGLPIIPHASRGYVSLQTRHSHPLYTLLDEASFRLFNEFDTDYNLRLNDLPSNVASLVLQKGPIMLNVQSLSNDKVLAYLNAFLQRSTRSTPSSSTVSWLLSLWEWIADWKDSSSLLRRIEDMNLIPCLDDLKPSSKPLFSTLALSDTTINHLKALSLSFVHRDFCSWRLSSVYTPKDPTNLHAVIDALPSAIPSHLPRSTAEGILRHITNYATASSRKRRFTQTEMQQLRSLPIYSVVDPKEPNLLACLPISEKIQFVENPPAYLPRVPGTVFVKLAPSVASQLAAHLAPASDRISTEGLLDLALDHFSDQTPQVRLSMLQEIERNRYSIPPRIIKKLADTRFLQVAGRSADISPSAAIDPFSSLARLFEKGNPQLPLAQGAQLAILRHLHNINLMKSSLTVTILSERIKYISRQHSSSADAIAISQELLSCLYNNNTDFDVRSLDPTLANHQDLPWLPTDQGLSCPKNTWDASDISTSKHLYNKVLRCLDFAYSTRLAPGLKSFLGWDRPLPQVVIIEQFERILASPENSALATRECYEAATEIISELSRRTLSTTKWNELKSLTAGQRWVPTSNGILVETQDAIFGSVIPNSGFHQIRVAESSREFMTKLGCMERPTTAAIIRKIRALGEQQPSIHWVNAGCQLLDSLPEDLSEDDRDTILIPDTTMIFRPLSRTKYDDVFASDTLLSDELGEYFVAHPSISDQLAHKLGLDRLGLQFATALPGLSMGAKPLAQIQNVLKGYDPRQFLIEFVANAVDAKAKCFCAMINEHVGKVSSPAKVLSPSTMSDLVKGPSLVIYNDAIFEDQDFSGICETSVGSKAGLANTIGRFGLGSATMFYFCEVAMIISRGCVLFLNPSGKHLPMGKTALMLSLNKVRALYPDHLAALDGIFGFDATTNTSRDYNGTLFVLPLRTRRSRLSEWAYTKTWDPEEIRRDVFQPFFEEMASNCLLFTDLKVIEAQLRSQSSGSYVSWVCSATRTKQQLEDPSQSTSNVSYSYRDVTISSGRDLQKSVVKWRVAQQLDLSVPDNLLVGGYRFQNPAAAGIAARLGTRDRISSSSSGFHYFSTLPLPINTSLGVHIMASFYLSPDRRSIRLDRSDAGDTRYNRWLLRDIIPPLYLFLLESLATNEVVGNKAWWPKVSSGESQDYICEEMIESFYSDHLPNTLRQVFNSVSSPSVVLRPDEAVILQIDLPAAVRHALNHLKPERLASPGGSVSGLIQRYAKTSLVYVTPEFLRDQIYEQDASFCQLFSPSIDNAIHTTPRATRTNVQMLQEIYNYLSASNLEGLPILTLSNDAFVSFEQASSSRQYFAWPTGSGFSSFRHNFGPHHFIHPSLDQACMAALGLNVVTLDVPGIVRLVGETVLKQDIFRDVPSITAEWISEFWRFWDCYESVGLQPQHVQAFPLIPTISPDRYVSLKACEESGPALLIDTDYWPNLEKALTALDLSVVLYSKKAQGRKIYEILQGPHYPSVTLKKLVRALQDVDVLRKFDNQNRLDSDLACWANWARSLVTLNRRRDGRIESMARKLPIWPSCLNSQVLIQSADDTNMLPQHMDMQLATQFIARPLSNYGSLEYLNGPKVEYQHIPGLLNLHTHVATSDLELRNFKEFINSWIERVPYPSQVSLYIPNFIGEFKLTSTLYARDQLFRDAFGDNSERFTSSVIQPLEEKLERYGLKRQSKLDFDMFIDCANSIDQAIYEMDPNDDRAKSRLCDRAAAVFKVYATDVAIIAHKEGAQKERLLSQLDELAFIPRSEVALRARPSGNEDGIPIPDSVTSLPCIVKPSNLVREEFKAVAWTQRAYFKTQPDECILPIYDKLGRPSMLEVVLHIESLCDISKSMDLNPAQKSIIIEDVKHSYAFLMKRLPPDGSDTSIGDSLPSDVSDREIFLNVDDAVLEQWTWRSAKQLIYTDKDDDQHVFRVKHFLTDYKQLLTHVGVLTEYQPSVPENTVSQTHTDSIVAQRLHDLRLSRQFTDIVIEATDASGTPTLLHAHRVFLAASSSDSTTFNMSNLPLSTDQNLPTLSPRREGPNSPLFSESSVNYLLNCIYSPQFRAAPDEIPLTDLLEAFLLAYQWKIDDVFSLIEIPLIKLIKPRTLKTIRNMATRCNATNLITACEEYGTKNKTLVERVLGGF